MLSINVPVFNIEVTNLVLELINQAEKLDVPFEIRVYDDGSRQQIKNTNRTLAEKLPVVYFESRGNMGRAAIRNRMGMDAQFKYLLFIDADSKIINPDFLRIYLDNVRPQCVLCGGTVYTPHKPVEQEKLLRWVYGNNRETIPAGKRNAAKGFIITSNNFLIEKEVFTRVPFRENLKNYGHEDTLLGYDLFLNGIEFLHIDNPVEHTGLEQAETFLEKTRTALENLKIISEEWLAQDHTFIRHVRFLRRYNKITRILPPFILKMIYKANRKILEKNLTGKHPRLIWFDIYKLCYYSYIKNR